MRVLVYYSHLLSRVDYITAQVYNYCMVWEYRLLRLGANVPNSAVSHYMLN